MNGTTATSATPKIIFDLYLPAPPNPDVTRPLSGESKPATGTPLEGKTKV
jgi:hypothetical protein